MTDTAPNPDDVIPDAMARAITDGPDGRAVLMVQETPGAALRWFVPDARYSDGWREVTDRDEIGALVADINTHQAEAAGPVTSGPGPDPVLVKGDNGASHIGTGLTPVMVGETGPEIVELPEGTEITRPDEPAPDDSEPDE